MTPLNFGSRADIASWMASAVVTPLLPGATAATQTGGWALHVHGPARICRFSSPTLRSGGLAPGSVTTCVSALKWATSSSV